MTINVLQSSGFGWKFFKTKFFKVWFKGYFLDNQKSDIFRIFDKLLNQKNINFIEISKFAKSLTGHFSIIFYNSKKTFCIVDHTRTIPLFYYHKNKEIFISSDPLDILKDSSSNLHFDNKQAALEISMSGFTIGNKTLCNKVFQLQAGEFLFFENKNLKINRYYFYKPWNVHNLHKTEFKKKLTQELLKLMKRIGESCKDRQILIPLSGGYDSRLIASGLKKIGVNNVVCFSYGQKNNFESLAAKKIAKRLNYQYIFIPTSRIEQKNLFNKNLFKKFLKYSDTLCNSPVLIDFAIIKKLYENKKISKNAIIINGNSGDFISGGHVLIQDELKKKLNNKSMIKIIMNKHFSLWESLKTKKNQILIEDQIYKIASEIIKDYSISNKKLWAVVETLEWYCRQSKWVTTTQRSYEFFGYEWRLPLWDPLFMNFWERVPLRFKYKQNLYKEVLVENNWGNVWQDIELNNFKLPKNIFFLFRTILKLTFIFIGKNYWKKFDKRVFSYFYDNTASTAIEDYKTVLFDTNVARDRNSWISRRYLTKKRLNFFK